MLIIYGALALGGIETFLVRLAKQRKLDGLKTKVLLTLAKTQDDLVLLEQMKEYADVYFLDDLFSVPPIASKYFMLALPLNKEKIRNLMEGVDHIHVGEARSGLLANKMLCILKKDISITVGFYHSLEYAWGGNDLPYFERVNRRFVFDQIPRENLLLYSKTTANFYKKRLGCDLSQGKTFRIGVIENSGGKNAKRYTDSNATLKICSVGRFTNFKTYNLWMLDVIHDLKKTGVEVKYDMYGYGATESEIREKISKLGLGELVEIKGVLNYSDFDATVVQYDLFVGSGTAIIQAAALGVCSIVGVESIVYPETYGYLADCSDIDFNVSGQELQMIQVRALIDQFLTLSVDERQLLSDKHREKAKVFFMDVCSENIGNNRSFSLVSYSRYRYLMYSLSYYFHVRFYCRWKGVNFYAQKYAAE